MRIIILWSAALFLTLLQSPAAAQSFHFIKSQSGPSGKVVDNKFVFDEVRNRFVYPQDKTFTVYFEWDAPEGMHVLSALWKDPQGRVSSISPDIKMETRTRQLHAYWIFQIEPGMSNGVWTGEIRIDGEPAGSHSFELVVPEPPKPEAAPPPPPRPPTLEEIYTSAGRSVVWIYKLDEGGHRADAALGFVIGPDQVATAFQAMDGERRVEVEFAGGRKEITEAVWACNRLQDWAVLKVSTGNAPALPRTDGAPIPIGERYLVFNVENAARVIGGIDITGRRSVPDFGDRIQISPSPSHEAVGGPLLTPDGRVAGIVGGSLVPGSRFTSHAMSVSTALWTRLNAASSATPIGLVPVLSQSQPAFTTFSQLLANGVLTAPIVPTASLAYGGSARSISKTLNDARTNDASEFTRSDPTIWIYTLWVKKDKTTKGFVSAKVYDPRNRMIVEVAPKKLTLPEAGPTRLAFEFQPKDFRAGVYRVDVLWSDQVAWRTFFTITD